LIVGSLFTVALLLGFDTRYVMNKNVDFFTQKYHQNMVEARKGELKSELTIVLKVMQKIYEPLADSHKQPII